MTFTHNIPDFIRLHRNSRCVKAQRYCAIVLICAIAGTSSLFAQQNAQEEDFSNLHVPAGIQTSYADFEVKPLEQLIELAMQNSPALKESELESRQKETQIALTRRSWTDLVYLGGTVGYGTGTVFSNADNGLGASVINTNTQQTTYNLSVGFNISGSDIFRTPKEAEVARIELERTVYTREMLRRAIREEVIERYNLLAISVRLLATKAEALENMRMACETGSEYFERGTITVNEYSDLLDKKTTATESYEQGIGNAIQAYMSLKEIVGAPIK